MTTTSLPKSPTEQRVEAERAKLIDMLRRGYDSVLAGRIVRSDELERQLDEILADHVSEPGAEPKRR